MDKVIYFNHDFRGFNQFGSVSEAMRLEKSQFQPFSLYDSFDSFVRGLTTQECQRFDNFVSDSVRLKIICYSEI
jgi:hypothetical protein